jgi:hypothetical protein
MVEEVLEMAVECRLFGFLIWFGGLRCPIGAQSLRDAV